MGQKRMEELQNLEMFKIMSVASDKGTLEKERGNSGRVITEMELGEEKAVTLTLVTVTINVPATLQMRFPTSIGIWCNASFPTCTSTIQFVKHGCMWHSSHSNHRQPYGSFTLFKISIYNRRYHFI